MLLKHGEYRIERVLGQGGFGITYEAEQVSLGRKVAVKEFYMKEHCNRDDGSRVSVPSTGSRELVEKFRDKFIREARMLAGFDHQSIVRVIDVFEENGTAYYVMKYLEGGSLQSLVNGTGRLSETEALKYIREISGALGYIHSRGTLHLDVKPGNIMLDGSGRAVLIDFGISKHVDVEGHLTSSTPLGISKGFAPLEQYQQGSDIKSFTPATDIYSLGATLFALLTGSNPPEASVINEDGIPAINGISPNVMCAIEKAMQPRRKDRPQSVAGFLAILDGTVKEDDDEQTVISAPAAKEQKPEKAGIPARKSKGFPKWLYGLIAGIAVAVLAAVLLNRPDKTDTPDNLQTDSTAVVTETVPENPVTSKPSASASKPETPSKPEAPAVVELKSISLSKSTLELEEGQSATLTVKYSPTNATDKATTWKSSDASVAKVSTNGKVTAVKAGSAAIIASCQGKDAYCNVTVKSMEVQSIPATTGTHAGHEWVDLGLSVKWATCNVGASSPEGYGSYFAWGETSPKSNYVCDNLKYCYEGDGSVLVKFSKYVNESKFGAVDNKTHLDLSDDAAFANWGGIWRMPTRAEQDELREKCTWTWTTMNGQNGYKVTSKSNGNSIFLPAAGNKNFSRLDGAGSLGNYWSSSLSTSGTVHAYGLFFNASTVYWYYFLREGGKSVRPVFR